MSAHSVLIVSQDGEISTADAVPTQIRKVNLDELVLVKAGEVP